MPSSDDHKRDPLTPPAPTLPDVDSPPPEDVLDNVPSTEEIIERAEPAHEIVNQQPSVEDVLQRRR